MGIEDIYYIMKRKYPSSIFYCCKLVINFLIFVEAELGKHVFRNVLLSILDISENIVGLRFITVDAYASAFGFYVEKNYSNI